MAIPCEYEAPASFTFALVPIATAVPPFAIEFLPGQYDQRADACEQCFQLLTGEKNVKVKCAKLIVLFY